MSLRQTCTLTLFDGQELVNLAAICLCWSTLLQVFACYTIQRTQGGLRLLHTWLSLSKVFSKSSSWLVCQHADYHDRVIDYKDYDSIASVLHGCSILNLYDQPSWSVICFGEFYMYSWHFWLVQLRIGQPSLLVFCLLYPSGPLLIVRSYFAGSQLNRLKLWMILIGQIWIRKCFIVSTWSIVYGYAMNKTFF